HLHGAVAEADRTHRRDNFHCGLGSGSVCAARGRIVREAHDSLSDSVTLFINAFAAQSFAVELRKIGLAGNAQVNLDLPNISLSRRNQLDPIAVGIGQFKRHRDAGIGNGESLVSAAWASWWQGVAGVVDLKYRAEQAIAMLLHSAAQAQEFLVGQS